MRPWVNHQHFTQCTITQYIIKHCSVYISTTLGSLAVKTVTAVKALQLLDDLYKLSKLRLAVTAVKAV